MDKVAELKKKLEEMVVVLDVQIERARWEINNTSYGSFRSLDRMLGERSIALYVLKRLPEIPSNLATISNINSL